MSSHRLGEESDQPLLKEIERFDWLQILSKEGLRLKNAPKRIKNDKELVIAAIRNDYRAFYYAPRTLQIDRDVEVARCRQMIAKDKNDEKFSMEVQSDRSIRREEYVYWLKKVHQSGSFLQDVPAHLRNDKKFLIESFQYDQYYYDPTDDLEKLASVRKDHLFHEWKDRLFDDALSELQADREVEYAYWMSKVKESGSFLREAPAHLRNDRKFLIEAIQYDYLVFDFIAPSELEAAPEVEYEYWMSKLKRHGCQLCDTPKNIRNDKKIVLAAVKEDGRCLEYASPDIQNDRQVVVAAVQQNGHALRYATPELRNDMEIVTAAVQQTEKALQHASPDLQHDREVVLAIVHKHGLPAAVQQSPVALRYASDSLKQDDDIPKEEEHLHWSLKVVENWRQLHDAPEYIRSDKRIVSSAIQQNVAALQYASAALFKNDKDFVLKLIKKDPDVIKYVHEDVKHDPELLTAAGMYDENHENHSSQVQTRKIKKIILSSRFSLQASSHSQATHFTQLLKEHEYIRGGGFKVYARNAFDNKQTCDPNHPTDDCCLRHSFRCLRCQLKEARDTGGFMLQLIETEEPDDPPELGNGQKIEHDMARDLKLKIFHVYRPMLEYEQPFEKCHIEQVVDEIKYWYGEGNQDMSECVIRPTTATGYHCPSFTYAKLLSTPNREVTY